MVKADVGCSVPPVNVRVPETAPMAASAPARRMPPEAIVVPPVKVLVPCRLTVPPAMVSPPGPEIVPEKVPVPDWLSVVFAIR